MSYTLNRVTLMGNVSREPDVKAAGQSLMATFSIAQSEKKKTKTGEWKEETQYFNITAWGKLAEICAKYLVKGTGVYIEGRLVMSSWQDKQTGKKRSSLSVRAEDVTFIGGKVNPPSALTEDGETGHKYERVQVTLSDNGDIGLAEDKSLDIPF